MHRLSKIRHGYIFVTSLIELIAGAVGMVGYVLAAMEPPQFCDDQVVSACWALGAPAPSPFLILAPFAIGYSSWESWGL
jgi:hypothetical protein